MGHLNADTDLAATQSYFEKFVAVEQGYKIPEKETYKNHGYRFMVFQTAATADAVQETRPHTLMGRDRGPFNRHQKFPKPPLVRRDSG